LFALLVCPKRAKLAFILPSISCLFALKGQNCLLIYACLLSTKGAYYGANKQVSISAQLLASPFAPKGQTSISKR
jgi:hypothetical protein